MGEESPDAAESGPDSGGRLFTRSQQPYAATDQKTAGLGLKSSKSFLWKSRGCSRV